MPDDANRIECALKLLPVLRAQIDADELALLEEARTQRWSWGRIAGVYGFSVEGARMRHHRLIAERDAGRLPQAPAVPGEVLRKVLKGLGVSQVELARRTGLSPKHVNQVIKGYVAVSAPIAIKLEDATGIPAMVWNTVEAAYRDAIARKAAGQVEASDG
jgi:addiction module HigA family antidote